MAKKWKPDGYGGYKLVEVAAGEVTMPELDVWHTKVQDAYEVPDECVCGVSSVGGGEHSDYCKKGDK